MIIAAMAGIRVFATGGIGGVHRGAERSFDVSADLQELAQTPVAVVCAGAKSILDLGLTLEYLETHGVPVIGHRCDHLPAFFTRDSAFKLDHRLDEAADIAATMQAKWQLQLRGGVVVANPDSGAIRDAARQDRRRHRAGSGRGRSARRGRQGIHPFLLARVCELTGGNSLAANIQLVLNNARLASAIAARYCELSAG